MDAFGRAWRRLLFWVRRRRMADELLRLLVLGIDHTIPAFVAAGTVLAAAVLAGCYLPARRAARIDPAVVLRLE